MLNGKKTYLVGIAAILTAVAGFLSGTITLPDAIDTVTTALMGMSIRHGISTATKVKP